MSKSYIYAFVVIFFAVVMIPLPCAFSTAGSKSEDFDGEKSFKVYLHEQDKVAELSEKEYLCGVVAAEVGGEYHEEALKAQAVAAYTMAVYVKEKGGDKAELKGADFSDDSATFQSYMSQEQFKEREGENWEEQYKRIEDAVEAVYGEVLTFDGELAQSVYHAISGGRTESSEVAFGDKVEYLTPVPSVGDLLSKDYQSEAVFSTDELKEKLAEFDIKWGKEPDKWFSDWEISQSGTVQKVNVSKTSLTGGQIRSALGLHSANFEVSYKDEKFTFICRGYGHGVGMSQNGAEYMAQSGSKYDEILEWYYPGCSISRAKQDSGK